MRVNKQPDAKVAVNLLWCVPGQVGGSEQYLVRQLLGFREHQSGFDTTLYCLPTFVDAHPELADDYEIVSAGISGSTRPSRIVYENSWLARQTRDADLVHHGGGTIPAVGKRPIVLTIHDLQYLTYPEYVSTPKLRYLEAVVPRAARRASIVAVPTEYVKETVTQSFGVDPERVVVVPHGVEPTLGQNAPTKSELRSHYALGDGRVLIFPAITHPHKGHRFLLDVMSEHWHDPDLRLVLLGGVGVVETEINDQITSLGLDHRVIRPGRVSDAHRDGLIALATALVFPSEYEGFGAPAVEAMALGTPVICSDQPALVEVTGGAALTLPLASDAWVDALDQVDDRSAEMISAGQARATNYTSAKSGAALRVAYEASLGGGS
jgi:glycosyltransferase involved in cell wall biosynthesis